MSETQAIAELVEANTKLAIEANDLKNFSAERPFALVDGEIVNLKEYAAYIDPVLDALKLLTICILVMKNGFTVIGTSAPASPENFDAEKGRTFARENAIRQLWPLEGYALREKLAATPSEPTAQAA